MVHRSVAKSKHFNKDLVEMYVCHKLFFFSWIVFTVRTRRRKMSSSSKRRPSTNVAAVDLVTTEEAERIAASLNSLIPCVLQDLRETRVRHEALSSYSQAALKDAIAAWEEKVAAASSLLAWKDPTVVETATINATTTPAGVASSASFQGSWSQRASVPNRDSRSGGRLSISGGAAAGDTATMFAVSSQNQFFSDSIDGRAAMSDPTMQPTVLVSPCSGAGRRVSFVPGR